MFPFPLTTTKESRVRLGDGLVRGQAFGMGSGVLLSPSSYRRYRMNVFSLCLLNLNASKHLLMPREAINDVGWNAINSCIISAVDRSRRWSPKSWKASTSGESSPKLGKINRVIVHPSPVVLLSHPRALPLGSYEWHLIGVSRLPSTGSLRQCFVVGKFLLDDHHMPCNPVGIQRRSLFCDHGRPS